MVGVKLGGQHINENTSALKSVVVFELNVVNSW